MLLRTLSCLALGATLALPIALTPTPAQACGGFFCNAATQTPVYQQGERVLFAQYDGLVTMHIEVMYGGEDPSKFAWLLPVPDVPKGADGQPLPLDKAVSISLPELFTNLQTSTNPNFTVSRSMDPSYEACNADSAPTFVSNDASSWVDSGSAGDTQSSTPPPVVILEEAKVGPYDAQLLDATSSDALYTWLNTNGYYQDPAAKPLLAYYLNLGYKFVGIRLQADKETDDLQPLALRLGEDAPCVPLRLTSIAAAPDMPILVWVAGEGRAVPKNFIHAEVNPQAINWPSASNYVDTVTAAIDMAAGRAWVTEFADSTDVMKDRFDSAGSLTLADANTLVEVLSAASSLSQYAKYMDILRDEVPQPAELRGYPPGFCEWERYGCEPAAEHVPTEGEFYEYLQHYAGLPDSPVAATDLDRLKARLTAEIIEPAKGIAEVFNKTTHLTRFFTTIDPEDMTKDPIFAFNPNLPPVNNRHTVDNRVYGNGVDCNEAAIVSTYDDGSTHTRFCADGASCWFDARTSSAVPGASPLKNVQVLDETGEPVNFDVAQAMEVDTYLDNAVAGTPSLTDQERASLTPPTVKPPANSTPPGVPAPTPSFNTPSSDGCQGGTPGRLAPSLLGLMLGLAFIRRRTSHVNR